jgi:16S rRNA (guanine966-N2)-methyltransferase
METIGCYTLVGMGIRILGGTYKGREIQTPKGDQTRPITAMLRKSLFDSCQFFIEGATVLDLFAGSGSIGIEAISRGAERVYFVDKSPLAIRCIRENIEFLKIEQKTSVFQMDAFQFFSLQGISPIDILFLHPPYPIGEAGFKELIHYVENNLHAMRPSAHFYLETPLNLLDYSEALLSKHFDLIKKRSASATGLLHFCIKST